MPTRLKVFGFGIDFRLKSLEVGVAARPKTLRSCIFVRPKALGSGMTATPKTFKIFSILLKIDIDPLRSTSQYTSSLLKKKKKRISFPFLPFFSQPYKFIILSNTHLLFFLQPYKAYL
jgi:hypothetical protein